MNRDIENLKEEITSKDQQLVKEHFDSKKVLASVPLWYPVRRGTGAVRPQERARAQPASAARSRGARTCQGVPPSAGMVVGCRALT
jgi:hypothetical protein